MLLSVNSRLTSFDSDASAGSCISVLDHHSGNDEFRSAITPHLPQGVASTTRTGILEEGKAMQFHPGEVVVVVCVCH